MLALTARREVSSLMGWDGISKVSFNLKYIPTCTCNKKLPPIFLWALKFDVKLEVGEHFF